VFFGGNPVNSEGFKRKLTAILSADVEGYSALMRDDEEATVRTLNTYKEMMFILIERNQGRLVDSTGDNLLAEFSSVVDGVRCAVQIQEDLKEKNKEQSENRKMEFRIGINLGDVIQEGDRIYGDGVNVAARIESLADGGGVCISQSAYDQVKKKLDVWDLCSRGRWHRFQATREDFAQARQYFQQAIDLDPQFA
jgi:adenylate cyclase